MTSLYPLSFLPILKERVWGGRRLASLGKALPPGPIGESWELVDLPSDGSRVAGGPLAGAALRQLIDERPAELLGPAALDGGSFPLLVKYIDAAETLSVQVHPDGEAAARRGGRPKSEAWLVLDAAPGARLYVGFRAGTTRRDYEEALAAGRVEELLSAVPVAAGDLVPVVPGTVHAIGAGVLLAEVQQPSDTTYRVYDWGRVGLDGKPRELHLAEALASMRFEAQPAVHRGAAKVGLGLFTLEVVPLVAAERRSLAGEGPLVVVGCTGAASILAPDAPLADCSRGGVVLVPHAARATSTLVASEVDRRTTVLVVSFPQRR